MFLTLFGETLEWSPYTLKHQGVALAHLAQMQCVSCNGTANLFGWYNVSETCTASYRHKGQPTSVILLSVRGSVFDAMIGCCCTSCAVLDEFDASELCTTLPAFTLSGQKSE